MEMPDFADALVARKVLRDLYPSASVIDLVEHGYDNIVGLVDHAYAVRFPRNENAYARSKYEQEVLKALGGITSVAIPKVLGEGNTPAYVITTFLEGVHYSRTEVRNFLEKEQIDFGEKVAEFAYEMHSKLSVEEGVELRKQFGLDKLEEEPWDTHLTKMVFEYQFPTKLQTELAKKYYLLWKEVHAEKDPVVVHDDLHNENMLFNNKELVGVLDFGDTNIGSPEQEFRQLYRINDLVLESAIERYQELSGKKLDIQASRAWAIVQELGVYADRISKKDREHPSFSRATKNLNRWLPEGEWEESDESSIRSSQ
jgi:aminoglycoside phosphotransferase (APT) family kinase protein